MAKKPTKLESADNALSPAMLHHMAVREVHLADPVGVAWRKDHNFGHAKKEGE